MLPRRVQADEEDSNRSQQVATQPRDHLADAGCARRWFPFVWLVLTMLVAISECRLLQVPSVLCLWKSVEAHDYRDDSPRRNWQYFRACCCTERKRVCVTDGYHSQTGSPQGCWFFSGKDFTSVTGKPIAMKFLQRRDSRGNNLRSMESESDSTRTRTVSPACR